MEIPVTDFLQMLRALQRHAPLKVAPEKPMEQRAEDPFAGAFEIVARPKLTLVANR